MSNSTTHTLAVIVSPAGVRQSSSNENLSVAATINTLPLPPGEGGGGGAFQGEGAGGTDPTNQVYNVAVGDRTTLNQLYEQLHLNLLPSYPHLQGVKPVYRDFRAGDVRHSLADISKAAMSLGYQPTHRIGEGLKVAMEWYIRHVAQQQGTAHRLDKNIMSGGTDAIRRWDGRLPPHGEQG